MARGEQTADQPIIDPHANCWHASGVVRLTDPCMKDAFDRAVHDVTKDRESAMRFLQTIGVCTADGKLSGRYGG